MHERSPLSGMRRYVETSVGGMRRTVAAASRLQLIVQVSERAGMPCRGTDVGGITSINTGIIHMYSGHADAKAVTYVCGCAKGREEASKQAGSS